MLNSFSLRKFSVCGPQHSPAPPAAARPVGIEREVGQSIPASFFCARPGPGRRTRHRCQSDRTNNGTEPTPAGRARSAGWSVKKSKVAADENVLGIKLSDDSKAAARWSLETGGEYYGVGAGTGISGFRANLGVGDDLFGSREDAYSETVDRSAGIGTRTTSVPV